MEQKTIVTAAVVGVVALVVGYSVGMSQQKASYAEKIAAVAKMFPSVPEMRSVSGTVKSVSGKVITVETQSFGNPFENIPSSRQITVTDKTKITKNQPIEPAAFQKLNDAYQAAMQKFQKEQQALMASGKPLAAPTTGTVPTPPMPFKEVTVAVGDIKAGDSLTVNSDKDIKMATSFEASSITVSGSATPPPGAANAMPPVAPAGTPAVPPAAPILPGTSNPLPPVPAPTQ